AIAVEANERSLATDGGADAGRKRLADTAEGRDIHLQAASPLHEHHAERARVRVTRRHEVHFRRQAFVDQLRCIARIYGAWLDLVFGRIASGVAQDSPHLRRVKALTTDIFLRE